MGNLGTINILGATRFIIDYVWAPLFRQL